MHKSVIPILSMAGLLVACGGEKKSSHETGDNKAAVTLAACAGTIPDGATNCLLDLGTATNTYWSDSDGVDPATAGCHYEFADATCGELKEGRTFGELCLDDDRLVESNPAAGECHTHGKDMGKPAIVSCSDWCKSQNANSGRCESGVPASGEYGSCESARCVCDGEQASLQPALQSPNHAHEDRLTRRL